MGSFFSVYLILINAAAFLLMRADKHRAKNKLWRIPERVLLGTALMGGSLGAYLGMILFSHKTRKPRFSVMLPLLLVIHVILFFLFY